MRFSADLVRYEGGWQWVVNEAAPLRIETCQGHAGDTAEIIRKAEAELVTYSYGQTEITVGIDPSEVDPIPGIDWGAADELYVDGDWREAVSLDLKFDDATSRVDAVPQFGTVLDAPAERVDRQLRSLGGLNGGTSHLARPVGEVTPPGVKPA